jgi:putative RecB family exonuclease
MGHGRRTMRIYSHSALESFEKCPRQYWYRYIGKPEVEKEQTVEAFLGICVHKTLEQLYRLRLGGRALSEEQTLALFESIWAKGWSEAIRIVSEELNAGDYRRAGREALATYHRRHAPFDRETTLRTEARVTLDLDGRARYRMQGYVDRIARRPDGTYEIHDYKTSGHLPTQEDADTDRQLALYQIGLQGMWIDVEAVDLIWHYLRFDTDLVSHRTPEQLRAVRQACIAGIEDIEARGAEEESFPTQPSTLCSWCEFRMICPAVRHQFATAALPPEAFKADSGVQLVDAWAQAVEKRKALEAEAKTLKAAEDELQSRVEAFAAKEGLEAVVGSGYRAEVARVSEVTFPKPGSEQRTAFDAALQETGVWAQVAAPNAQKLKSLLGEPAELTAEVRERLGPFITRIEKIQAKLKRLKGDE